MKTAGYIKRGNELGERNNQDETVTSFPDVVRSL